MSKDQGFEMRLVSLETKMELIERTIAMWGTAIEKLAEVLKIRLFLSDSDFSPSEP